MDCQDAGIRLKDLVAGRLAPADRKAIEQHLRHCPTCAAAAVSLAHPAEERALWEHAGRVAARHLKRTHTSPSPRPLQARSEPRSPVVLRHAHPRKKTRIPVSIHIRLLQAIVIGLAAAIVLLCGANFGKWNEFLGLDRWAVQPASPAGYALAGEGPALPEETTIFSHASRTLAEVAIVTDGPRFSAQIRSSGIVARLHAERRQPGMPEWIRSAAAPVEAVLIRAEAAGSDLDEWRMVRRCVIRHDLVRVCKDLDASTKLLSEGNEP